MVVKGIRISSSQAPGGQGLHRIILVRKIKITFQKVLDNFAFIKKIGLFSDPSVHLCVCVSVPAKSSVTFDALDGSA